MRAPGLVRIHDKPGLRRAAPDSGDPLAITINETDEARALWEVVLYFGSEEEAADARQVEGLADGVIAPMPQQDWVRQSLEGLAPVTAGRFFLHGSHDRHRRRPGGVSLEIDAGMAPKGFRDGQPLRLGEGVAVDAPKRELPNPGSLGGGSQQGGAVGHQRLVGGICPDAMALYPAEEKRQASAKRDRRDQRRSAR